MFTKTLTFFGWFLVVSLSLYFIYTNALRYFDFSSPAYSLDLKPFTLALVTHISGGILALLLGPTQFISRIRRKNPLTHRTIGKVYLIAIAVSGLVSLYLSIGHAIMKNGMVSFGVGLIGLAIAWLSTSAMAFIAIKERSFAQHREWMVRSYVVTCGFVAFRLCFDLLTKNTSIDWKEVASLTAWACWAVPLLVTEIVLQRGKLKKASKKATYKEGHTVIIASTEEHKQA